MDPDTTEQPEWTARMKASVKQAWIEWLRDPQNKQASGALRRDNGRCCLGGLCEVAKAAGLPIDWEFDLDDSGEWAFAGATGDLPDEVSLWAGIGPKSETGYIGDPFLGTRRASTWNDDHGKTLPEIAELVARYVEPIPDDTDTGVAHVAQMGGV